MRPAAGAKGSPARHPPPTARPVGPSDDGGGSRTGECRTANGERGGGGVRSELSNSVGPETSTAADGWIGRVWVTEKRSLRSLATRLSRGAERRESGKRESARRYLGRDGGGGGDRGGG